jgi:acetolactate synthase-1/2/3 large subunit
VAEAGQSIKRQAGRVKVTDYIARFLHERGVPAVFEMSGGMITHLLDSLHKQGTPRIVSMHHEQSAAFAADAVGRLCGLPGVALATSGPGAVNLLTGIGSCYFDSTPAVFITGQVNRNEQKGERPIRQLGFQETDIVSMARPLTKAAWMVRAPEEIPAALRRAFRLAGEGRPGPVLLDIPMDVQRAQIDASARDDDGPSDALSAPGPAAPDDILRLLREAERPLLLLGGGVRAGQAAELLRRFVQAVRVPFVTSLMGLDLLPWAEPLRVGFIGTYGNRWANLALGRSDLLLVLGSRLDVRQTGSDTAAFKAGRTVIHVDCEGGEMNNRVKGCQTVLSELRPFLRAALGAASGLTWPARAGWLAEIEELRRAWPDVEELKAAPAINPNVFMHALAHRSRAAAAYVVDVGQHQMWAAQSLELSEGQRFITSGGMGSMGFALPAAVGAACVVAPRPVVVVAGDGGFQTNIQELQTVARNRLPLKIVVVNNGCHGMVRQFQESYFEGRYQSTLWGYSAPDFALVAGAYGLEGRTVGCPSEVADGLEWLWRDAEQPALLQVMVDTMSNAYPKIAFGRAFTEMEPFARPREL